MLSFVEWNNAVVEQHVSVSHSESGDVVSNKQDNWQFRFHHVMHNAGQETVFDTLAAPIVSQATQGINGTIMAYGQTGAGKTFTMVRVQAAAVSTTPPLCLFAPWIVALTCVRERR